MRSASETIIPSGTGQARHGTRDQGQLGYSTRTEIATRSLRQATP